MFFDSGGRSCRIISHITIEDIIPWTKKMDSSWRFSPITSDPGATSSPGVLKG